MLMARRTPYLESEMLGLASIVGPGSVCLDVGAAAGLYTVVLSHLAGPAGEVHAVEPLQFAHPVWRWVLGFRRRANVRHYTLALGADPGAGVMSVPFGKRVAVTGRSFLTGKSSGLGPNTEFVRHEEVPVTVDTLDALVARIGLSRLDFIKIDVEGGELHVLQGGQGTIEEFRPALLVEIEARHTARYQYATSDLVEWLVKRDYQMYTWHGGWQETSTVTEDQRNYLFRPNHPRQ
jgi:FkbM family methyltransferase